MEKVEIKGKTFWFTGKFESKQKKCDKTLTRNYLHDLVREKGGLISKSVTKGFNYLIIGGLGSNRYIEGSKGMKILKAEKQPNTTILSEKEFLKLIEY